jgi:hypothetical protein
MGDWLRKLLCPHVWQIVKREDLGIENHVRPSLDGKSPPCWKWYHYLYVTHKCIKCGKMYGEKENQGYISDQEAQRYLESEQG